MISQTFLQLCLPCSSRSAWFAPLGWSPSPWDSFLTWRIAPQPSPGQIARRPVTVVLDEALGVVLRSCSKARTAGELVEVMPDPSRSRLLQLRMDRRRTRRTPAHRCWPGESIPNQH
jgi:hypothetical protein